MKRSIIRWTAASLAAASLGLALGGCGTKAKTTSSSEKASSSKVEKKPKASLNKKTTVSSSQTKEGVDSSNQASNTTASSETSKAGDTASTDQTVVPADLVGTWVGSSPQADSIKMTVEANGDITTVVSFKNDSEPTRTATYTARAIQASGNVYYWESEGLDGADRKSVV